MTNAQLIMLSIAAWETGMFCAGAAGSGSLETRLFNGILAAIGATVPLSLVYIWAHLPA